MKIFGHPVHMMLIHFPSALIPMECVFYALLYHTGKSSFADSSYYTMLAAIIFGWLAVVFGVLDLLKISPERTKVMSKALIHGSINSTVLIIYTVLAYSLYKKYPDLPSAKGWMLCLKMVLVLFMFVGNYLGGSLILKDKVAVEQ